MKRTIRGLWGKDLCSTSATESMSQSISLTAPLRHCYASTLALLEDALIDSTSPTKGGDKICELKCQKSLNVTQLQLCHFARFDEKISTD